MYTLSVVVCCAPNESLSLKKCLDSILIQNNIRNFEVLVVCDGIDNSNKELSNSYESLNIKYLDRENKKCLAESRNIGAKNAKSDFVVFLDSDIELKKNSLINYYNSFLKNPDEIVLGKYQAENIIMRPFFENKNFEKYINTENNKVLFYKPYFHSFFANSGMSKRNYFSVGGSNENFIGYGLEDISLGYKFYKKGFKFNFNNNISALHHKRNKDSEFYKKEYMMKNFKRLRDIIFEDVKRFFEMDEKVILKSFKEISEIYSKEETYTDIVRYFLFKGKLREALLFTKFANSKRVKSYFEVFKTGKIHWKKLFYEKNYEMSTDIDSEGTIYNLICLFPLV